MSPQRTVSDAQGAYALPSLRPGNYRLEAERAGFKKLIHSGIEVQVNAHLKVDLTLSIGQVTESVSVQACRSAGGKRKLSAR